MAITFEFLKKFQILKDRNTHDAVVFLIFLIAIVLFSYLLYVILYASPSGTDVYTHMYNTQNMAKSTSLSDFYAQSQSREYLGIDYPFGLWYFGSLTMKVTGLDVYAIAYLIPLILIFITLGMYYCYARTLTTSVNQSLLSLIFLVSMTQLSLFLLNFSTSVFVMTFLVTLFFLSLRGIEWKNILLIGIIVFTLCFTHTGTFLFLTIFAITYVLLRAAIWGKFDNSFYLLIVALLACFILAVTLFPFIQSQYIDKGVLFITTTASISSATHIGIFKDAGQIFYDTIFVENDYVLALLWAALLYVAGKFLVFIHLEIKKKFAGEKSLAAIPFIGTITTMSKGIVTTPFWVGPVQSLFSLIGVFKLDERGKCIALSLVFSSVLPGALAGSEGTGSIRETFYLFLLIPITAAVGFYHIYPYINRISKPGIKRVLVVFIYVIIFVPLIAVPIVACLHYQPTITMTKEENINLQWLGSVGNPTEGAAAAAYRDRMTMYANKTVPSLQTGTETLRYAEDLTKTYFSRNADKFTKDLSYFQVQYLIMSDRVMKGYTYSRSAVVLDTNQQVDRIYASGDFFGFYKIISPPKIPVTNFDESLSWGTEQTGAQIQNVGSVFLFENAEYKVKISDTSPKIRYLGSSTQNAIGEGDYSETIGITYGIAGKDSPQYELFDLGGLTYSEIQRSDTAITYKTKLLGSENDTMIASLLVKYSFYDLAVKREIIILNDLESVNRSSDITITASSTLFSPMSDFEYHDLNAEEKQWVSKKIYPAQDKVLLKDRNIDSIYFGYGGTGLYILYTGSSIYPNLLWYLGSTQYDYGLVGLNSDQTLQPTNSMSIVQYFSVNNKITAMKNAETYTSVSPYLFQDGQIPMVISGRLSGSNLTVPEKSALAMVSQKQMPYTVVLPASKTADTINLPGIIPEGYFSSCYNSTACKNFTNQQKELASIKQDTGAPGVLISDLGYNLDTIKSLSQNNYSYAQLLGGGRYPRFTYIDGENTGIVLMPIAQPYSSVLYHRYETDAIFSQWDATINSTIKDGGMAAFLWDPSDMFDPAFMEMFDSFISNSTSKGMTITTPDAIALHLKKLDAVKVNITRGVEYVTLNARNTEGEPVSGITYKLIMPLIDDACPYTITNGEISRKDILHGKCRVYASFNLNEFESKEIKIVIDIPPKQLVPYIPEFYQGKNTIRILDESNQPVKNASVRIDSQYYETNSKGEVTVTVNFGWRTITIEKAGYNLVTTMTYVKPLLYRYTKFMNEITP
jgi:hypothetical protein